MGSGQGDGQCPAEHLCPGVQMGLWSPGDGVHVHLLTTALMRTNAALSPSLSLLSSSPVPVFPVPRWLA